MNRLLLIAFAIAVALAASPSAATRAVLQPITTRGGERILPPLDAVILAKLAALSPDQPEAYFLLAEEVADGADDEPRADLARTLFVLAFELDRKRGGTTLAASCAMGIARVERLERDKRWLLAIASSVDRRYALPDWNVGATLAISDETAFKAASVLGLARSGDGREARRLLDQPGVAEVLRRYERAIGATGLTGALSRLNKYIQSWPCPECGNSRTVNKPGERGVEVRLCGTCRGNPGPRLDDGEYISQLRFEAMLLDGIQRSWAAQVVVDQGAPLRDPDLDELAPTYGVDPGKPYFRDFKWTDRP
jgi:hypothetical protein